MRRQLAGGSCSDHVALVRAFEGWEKARRDGGPGRVVIEHKHSTDVDSTNRVRASV